MTQILKPDRPIWPPIPEPVVPPETGAAQAEPAERAAAPRDRRPMDARTGIGGSREAFGSATS